MALLYDEVARMLVEGAGEIGITLTENQNRQFFFICGNFKNGTKRSI